jgi:hypothetical protein
MLSWWRQRKERQQQVVRDADNLMAPFGNRAYSEALARLVLTALALPAAGFHI